MLRILRVGTDGIDGKRTPSPWVAQIDGVDPVYGLARTFVQRLNDWRRARRHIGGRIGGVVAAFPLHSGRVYEVYRLRGRKRPRMAREFVRVVDGSIVEMSAQEALAVADGYHGHSVPHETDGDARIGRVVGVGTMEPVGFVTTDLGRRMHMLRVGSMYEVSRGSERRIALVGDADVKWLTQREAILWLASQ